ncbi:MAG: amidase [Acidimicrobiia bacterium]
MTDLGTLDAVGQAELVRTGQATPTELVDAAIARIEAVNPALNAVIRERFDRARAEAADPALADGPFRGVPLLLKDLSCEIAGETLYEGMRFLRDADYHAHRTDALAARFLDAGFVVLGRTNTPEIGLLPTTEPESYGPTHNPWRAGHTPGGSSGGSAAAVASGMVPAAHANDGGGSIRIPAACCGLVGLKPTRGRVPSGTDLNELTNFLVAEHVVTRTVRDTAAILDITGAPRAVGGTRAPTPRGPFAAEVGADPGTLRIGLLDADPTGSTAIDPDCVAAVVATGRLLESLGHVVEPSFPAAWADAEAMLRFSSVWATECAYVVDDWAAKVGRPVTEADVEPLTWRLAEMGRAVTGPQFMATAINAFGDARDAERWWRANADDFDDAGYDVLLTPTLGEPPVPHGTFPSTPDQPLTGFIRAASFVPFTTQSNISGQPAISLPMHTSANGLPVGIQLVGAFGREDLLIRVAAQLEAAAPWADCRPPVHA